MKTKYLTLALFLFYFIGMTSCSKKKYNNDPLRSEWLLPLLKGNVTPLTLTTLKNKKFHINVSAADLGIQENLPQTNPATSTFYNLFSHVIETNDLISSIQLDTCFIQIVVKNNFPVAIKQGTVISIRDGSGSDNILKSFVFSRDIANGKEEVFEIDLSGITINNKLKATVDTLIIEAYDNQIFSESVEIDFFVKTVSLNYANLYTNKHYVMADTVDFDGSTIDLNEYDDNITDSTVNAELSFFCNNELPVNSKFQIYFLDVNKVVVDSIFIDKPEIMGGVYSGLDFAEGKKSSFFTTVSKQRLITIKSATKVVYDVEFNTMNYSGTLVQVHKNRLLTLKLIGDIKLVLNSFLF